MQASTRFSVAIHILTMISASSDFTLTSGVMASSVNTNEVVIRRLLGLLKKAGFVESKSGTGGGWTLNRVPSEINIADVYRAVEQTRVLSIHQNPNPACQVGRNIQQTLDRVYSLAQTEMERSLGAWTLADVHAQLIRFEEQRA